MGLRDIDSAATHSASSAPCFKQLAAQSDLDSTDSFDAEERAQPLTLLRKLYRESA
ncbi:hypothetical protein ACUTAF_03615 [Pseudomonas sp. SP16.1]|uniref:hypothetical protein n=1 Tax=Pseudomonas sp. SP16.1 TaxID=3458854 RepID=UPI0040468667